MKPLDKKGWRDSPTVNFIAAIIILIGAIVKCSQPPEIRTDLCIRAKLEMDWSEWEKQRCQEIADLI